MKFKLMLVSVLFAFAISQAFCGSLLSYAPAESSLIVCLNLASVSAQPELKAIIDSQLSQSSNYAKELADTFGINPCTQISDIMLFADENKNNALVFTGSFSCASFSALLQTNEEMGAQFEICDLGSYQMVCGKKNDNANFLFLDDCTMAVGSQEALSIAANVASKKLKSVEASASFKGLSSLVNNQACLWGLVLPSDGAKKSVLPAGFKNMSASFFSLDYAQNFSFNFTGLVKQASELPELKAALADLLNALKGWAGACPEMSEVLKHAAVKDDNKLGACISVVMPANDFKAAMVKLTKQPAPKQNK